MGERMRGRAGQAALRRRREMHPVCAHCRDRGIVRAAVEIDHIQPLALGGEDVDGNTQELCVACHAIKTALEDASGGGAANHPDWLKPASCALTIVSGPPCSGKSTLVEREANPADLIIDLDQIADQIAPGFLDSRRWTSDLLNAAIRARNSLLGRLAFMPPRSAAWLIVGAPTKAERLWWASQLHPVDTVHLPTDQPTCVERAARRVNGTQQVDAVLSYFARVSMPWRPDAPRLKRQAIGEDGYPLEARA